MILRDDEPSPFSPAIRDADAGRVASAPGASLVLFQIQLIRPSLMCRFGLRLQFVKMRAHRLLVSRAQAPARVPMSKIYCGVTRILKRLPSGASAQMIASSVLGSKFIVLQRLSSWSSSNAAIGRRPVSFPARKEDDRPMQDDQKV